MAAQRSKSQSSTTELIIPTRPIRWPSSGEKIVTPALAQPLDLVGHDHAAAAADDLDVVGALGAQRLDEVLEVLDVPALVRRDRDALDVLLERGVDDLLHRAVVPEVDHLARPGTGRSAA